MTDRQEGDGTTIQEKRQIAVSRLHCKPRLDPSAKKHWIVFSMCFNNCIHLYCKKLNKTYRNMVINDLNIKLNDRKRNKRISQETEVNDPVPRGVTKVDIL